MSLRAFLLAALLSLAIGPRTAAAHETTRSYVTLERQGRSVEARLRMAFRDIEVVAWMDEDLDGRITWGETLRRLGLVDAYLRSNFSLEAGGACDLTQVGTGASTSAGTAYLDLHYLARCPDAQAPLIARSRLLAEIDPDHRTFLQASAGGASISATLSAASPSISVDAGSVTETFLDYFRAGVDHLLGGADHMAFLLVLMLPAVSAAVSARKAALGVLTAVTGFTFAHALTLTASATELLSPPSALVETLVALSIVITAADNVHPFIPAPRAAIAALFGTIHGFGFASALGGLELTGVGFATALVGFNLGVEAAQVGIVLIAMPALCVLGRGRLLLWIGSAAAAAAGGCWLWARLSPLLLHP
jgi:hypothetical protein